MKFANENTESCNCTEDYPANGTEKDLRLGYAFIIILYAIILITEVICIKRRFRNPHDRTTILIYCVICLVGYISMVLSEFFSAIKYSCWLVVIFRVLHYASFHLIGVIYILKSMMGKVRATFESTNNMKLYSTMKYMLYTALGCGVVSLIFMARNFCGVSGPFGYYFLAVLNILTALLLVGFLLIKYFIIKIYDPEQYKQHSLYYTILISYLSVIVGLGIGYYAAFYRFQENNLPAQIYYVVHSLLVMMFPVLITLYFAQHPAGLEESIFLNHKTKKVALLRSDSFASSAVYDRADEDRKRSASGESIQPNIPQKGIII